MAKAVNAAPQAIALADGLEACRASKPSTSETARRWRWHGRRWAACPRTSAPTSVNASTPPAARSNGSYDERLADTARGTRRAVLVAEGIDVTLPSTRQPTGARHPITIVADHIADTFVAMRWELAEGPEVEAEQFNFDALELPARSSRPQRTGHLLYRAGGFPAAVAHPHLAGAGAGPCSNARCRSTSSRSAEPPHRRTRYHPHPGIPPGRGLAVDRGLSMAHLRGTLDALARAEFGPQARTRIRPQFFPFTEPSAEVDVWFANKKGGPTGWSGVAAAWCTQTCCGPQELTREIVFRLRVRDGPGTHAAVPQRHSRHARHGRR